MKTLDAILDKIKADLPLLKAEGVFVVREFLKDHISEAIDKDLLKKRLETNFNKAIDILNQTGELCNRHLDDLYKSAYPKEYIVVQNILDKLNLNLPITKAEAVFILRYKNIKIKEDSVDRLTYLIKITFEKDCKIFDQDYSEYKLTLSDLYKALQSQQIDRGIYSSYSDIIEPNDDILKGFKFFNDNISEINSLKNDISLINSLDNGYNNLSKWDQIGFLKELSKWTIEKAALFNLTKEDLN